MPSPISVLADGIRPQDTILLFGAGSSIPSGAPSVQRLQEHFERVFGVVAANYTLSEQAGIIEQATGDRAKLIQEIRSQFKGVKPTGSLLNLPLYGWKSIFTTNYDELIEESFDRRERSYKVYSSNFDFRIHPDPDAIPIFKLHGTLGKDIAFGDHSRIILTDADYDVAQDFREALYDRLRAELAGSHLVIIGHSLADPDLKEIIQRASTLNVKSGAGGKISLLLYSRDEGRAALMEARGLSVYFAGLDDLFAALAQRIISTRSAILKSADPLDRVTALRPSTTDVGHASNPRLVSVRKDCESLESVMRGA